MLLLWLVACGAHDSAGDSALVFDWPGWFGNESDSKAIG
jgi:hypothetical protein